MSAVHLRHYFFVYNFQSAKSHYQHKNTHNNRLVGKINPQAVFADFVKHRNFEFKIFCKIFFFDEIPKIKACRKEENPRNNREIVCRVSYDGRIDGGAQGAACLCPAAPGVYRQHGFYPQADGPRAAADKR